MATLLAEETWSSPAHRVLGRDPSPNTRGRMDPLLFRTAVLWGCEAPYRTTIRLVRMGWFAHLAVWSSASPPVRD